MNYQLSAWQQDIDIKPVYPHFQGHTLHCYYTLNPESPDGRWVLIFMSTDAEGHQGDLCILERATGELVTLASALSVEDAHRQAHQQWTCGGEGVIFHSFRDDECYITYIDLASQEAIVLTKGRRQLGHGYSAGDYIPVFGTHWNPGSHRDIELLNARTGEITAGVTIDEVRENHQDWLGEIFSNSNISLFAARLSPDATRVCFKLSSPSNKGSFQDAQASIRLGLIVYDIKNKRFLLQRQEWGHPAWHPNSRTLINVPNILINSDTGDEQVIKALPEFPGSHPSFSPDGKLFVTDTRLTPFGGPEGHWGVVVAAVDGSAYHFVHRFDFNGGAQSWRPPHPHPTFSADGRRIYFNVNIGSQTILHVAECQS